MRIVPFITSTVITVALIFALNNRWGSIPALGSFFSPQTGFWQSAETRGEGMDADFSFANLKGKVDVFFDERLVPHVFAEQDEDAYFVQGFLHAKYRLWQMEFQTRYAAGRLSEVLTDPRLQNVDRLQRRLGMQYAAENMVQEMEKEPTTKMVLDAYTAGVNAYIKSLTQATLPLEYKLLGYKPEPWNNAKIALFVKLMCLDLAGPGYARDIEFTNEKAVFSLAEMDILYPQISDSTVPIIPQGTAFVPAAIVPVVPATVDSLYYGSDTTVNPVKVPKPVDLKGSNNWAISGSKTASGAPILANDPHLRLTLPSIWYEMQMQTPTLNVYGATLPSVPGIVIGFNDSIAFGFTNAGRDVIDYYHIRFKDESRTAYWYNGTWQACKTKVEQIKLANGNVINDTVAYTVFGPVIYDKTFNNGDSTITTALALRWTAHDASNEMLMWYNLNRATDYASYAAAIAGCSTPAQNMLFASKSGDIAIWQQGKFPARWKNQGLYIMPGDDSSYAWQGWIPQQDNPHVLNPPQGFIQSANQRAVDSTYPYFIPGDYFVPRGVAVHNMLRGMQQITPQDMMTMQGNTFNTLAEDAIPFLLKNTDENYLNEVEIRYLQQLKSWDFTMAANSKAATISKAWFDSLARVIWTDEFAQLKKTFAYPDEQIMMEILLRDSAFRFIDDISTPQIETLRQQVTSAFKMAATALAAEEKTGDIAWWKHKKSSIQHLLRDALPAFGKQNIEAGGWSSTINALSKFNGPSWRMVVHLTKETEAYGIYPAGQSGNPGSPFYDNFINDWVANKYYRLWMMKAAEANDKRIIGKLKFSKA